jgi:hypothetical protein
MTMLRTTAISGPRGLNGWFSWRTACALTAVAGGSAIVAGAIMPWATAFAGLLPISGLAGLNGRVLLGAGIVIAVAGLVHYGRQDAVSRWLAGLTGCAALAASGYLLLRLTAILPAVGASSMAMVHAGPGLWVIIAGSALAFCTMFMPASAQRELRAPAQAGRGLAAWAADRESAGPRRWLQMALGVAWLADAALQFQPVMFSRSFVTATLDPAAMGSPSLVATPVLSYGQLILHNPVAFNAAFATIQLALGAALLSRPTARAALAASVVWALTLWWVGEGMGMIFSGSASPLTGAPGAALLYVVVALLAWLPRGGARTSAPDGGVAANGLLGDRGARLAWFVIWGSAAYFMAMTGRTPGAVRAGITAQASAEPGWIAGLDRAAGAAIGPNSAAVAVALAVLFGLIAAGIFVRSARRAVVAAAVLAGVVIWVVGENFGGILTGSGTDPNTGPLLIILALAFWPLAAASQMSRTATARSRSWSGTRLRSGRTGPAGRPGQRRCSRT